MTHDAVQTSEVRYLCDAVGHGLCYRECCAAACASRVSCVIAKRLIKPALAVSVAMLLRAGCIG